jgi:hypothetical protein
MRSSDRRVAAHYHVVLASVSRATSPQFALVDRFTQNDPERQANIAFVLIFLGIVAVGALTIWLFYGASF